MEPTPQNPKSTHATTAILTMSVIITVVSVLYILSHLCFPFGCGAPDILDKLSYLGTLNPIVMFPLAYILGRGSRPGKLMIGVYICLMLVAAFPIIYNIYGNISSSIAIKKDRIEQSKDREIQSAQVELAKQANIQIEVRAATLSLIKQPNTELDEYSLNIPLSVSNLPGGLNSFNIACIDIEIAENVLADETKFHPECAYLMARKVNGTWTYKTYYWNWQDYIVSQTVSNKLEINAHFTSSRNVPLPHFKLAHLVLYIPFDFEQYSSPNPGGLSMEDSTIIDQRYPLNISKAKNY